MANIHIIEIRNNALNCHQLLHFPKLYCKKLRDREARYTHMLTVTLKLFPLKFHNDKTKYFLIGT